MAMPDTTRPNDEGNSDNLDGRTDHLIGTGADPLAGDPAELELGEDDVRLPWLEGEDDEEEYRGGGSGQIVLLAVGAIAALVLIIGGIWWFTRDGDGAMVADGGVIEAPGQPYKEKPENPGGKTFQGTGDTSFAVSEGETRTARLGESAQVPGPGFDAVAGGGNPASPAASADKAPGAASPAPADSVEAAGPSVQLGAYNSREDAQAGWSRLSSQHSMLSGQRNRIVEGRAEFGTVFRLQVLPGDLAAARALCSSLKRAGQDCTVKN